MLSCYLTNPYYQKVLTILDFRTASQSPLIPCPCISIWSYTQGQVLITTVVPIYEQESHWTQAATKLLLNWTDSELYRYLKTPNSQAIVTTRKMHCKNPVGVAKQILYRSQNTVYILQKHSLYRQEQISLKKWKRHARVLSSHLSQQKNHQILSYSEKIQTHLTSYSMTITISAGCIPHHLGHISAGYFWPIYVCQQHMDQAKQIKWSFTASKYTAVQILS